jgi:hypothetical protein
MRRGWIGLLEELNPLDLPPLDDVSLLINIVTSSIGVDRLSVKWRVR